MRSDLGFLSGERPYSPSWFNRIVTAIESLPGPPWAYYLALAPAEALLNNALRWLDGSLQPGTFDVFRVAEAPFIPYMLAAIYYLGRTAISSIESFRPVLAMEKPAYEKIRYELATTPAKQGLVVGILGIAVGIMNLRNDPAGYGISDATSGVTNAYVVVFAVMASAVGVAFLYHSTRQLWMVNRIHAAAKHIDIFESTTLYSFSRLTVRSGIAILIMVYYLNFFLNTIQLQGSAVGVTPLTTGIVVVGNVIAIASFILPLYGMHLKLAQEKMGLIEQISRRFKTIFGKLHEAIDTDDMERVSAVNKAIASLTVERETLMRISTWPWAPGTLRGFVSAIALPIIIFLITRILDRFLGT